MDEAALPAVWVIVIAATGALLGGGGVGALLKVFSDHKQGVDQHEITEDDAIASRWQALSEAQVKNLLEPMEKRLKDVESEVRQLKSDLAESRTKYWRAIIYLRSLLSWVAQHVSEATPPPPPIPDVIREDV